MAAFLTGLHTGCPLCGASMLSIGPGGRVTAMDVHPVPILKSGFGEGFTVCDECAVLAHLPAGAHLN